MQHFRIRVTYFVIAYPVFPVIADGLFFLAARAGKGIADSLHKKLKQTVGLLVSARLSQSSPQNWRNSRKVRLDTAWALV